MAHEDAYLKHLEAQGVSVLNLRDIEDSWFPTWVGSPPSAINALFLSEHAHRGCCEGAEGAQH